MKVYAMIMEEKKKEYRMIKTVGKVIRERRYYTYDEEDHIAGEKNTSEKTIYVSDLIMNVKTISGYIRKHWVLDNTFK